MDGVEHRRRRVRGGKDASAEPVIADAVPEAVAADAVVRRPDPAHTDGHGHGHHAHSGDDSERGLRGLIGGGSTQVGVGAAMRARDAARPTEADLAHATETLTIVHRGWQPRDPAGSGYSGTDGSTRDSS